MFIFQKPVVPCLATLLALCFAWSDAATGAAEASRAESFWSFAPLAASEVPEVSNGSWPLTTIDRFILARLEAEGIGPAQGADPAKLIRQLSFDLTGLPPSRDELDAFNADPSEARYHRTVDRLLSSPQFGERWGRHWLDVARYAEATWRSVWMTNAWRYRDYVVDSLNRDKPYDVFVCEQIAGDLLPRDDADRRREQVTATGFLALGPTLHELQDKKLLEMEVINEQIDTTGRAFLAMSLGCARCHDHPFDPFSIEDYYAFAGIFKSIQTLRHANVSTFIEQGIPHRDPEIRRKAREVGEQRIHFENRLATLDRDLAELESRMNIRQLDDVEATFSGRWSASAGVRPFVGKHYRYSGEKEATARFDFALDRSGIYEIRASYTPHANRASNALYRVRHADGETTVTVNQRNRPSLAGLYSPLGRFPYRPDHPFSVTVTVGQADGVVVADSVQCLPVSWVPLEGGDAGDFSGLTELRQRHEDRSSQRAGVLRALSELESESFPESDRVLSVLERSDVADSPVHLRGEMNRIGGVVPRGFPGVFSASKQELRSPDQSGRREMADWIVGPGKPLAARVMANRVWHQLMGAGLVRTVDNFGSTGEAPSHPELLDWLASRFIENGWSIKSLIRDVVTSRTYQLSTVSDPEAAAADPDNRLFGRMHRRRLDAEALRDTMLLISGQLDPSIGGPILEDPKSAMPGSSYEYRNRRRSLYLPVVRKSMHPLLEVFDFPDPNVSTGQRNVSTLASQSLFLLNSDFMMSVSNHAARRFLRTSANGAVDSDALLVDAFQSVLGRNPNAAERSVLREYLSDARQAGEDRLETWSVVFQSLFACVDFRHAN